METLLDDFICKMDIKNFSKSTKQSYTSELKKYLLFCDENRLTPNSDSFLSHLSHLIKIRKLSECSLKQSIGAVKFFLHIH